MPLAFSIVSWLHSAGVVAVLALGFGFVIFWHELGHFLAAKWVGIKVEQFAVGFGHAVFSWRKGVGLRFGNTQKEYRQQLDRYIEEHYKDDSRVQDQSGLEYQEALIEAEKATGLGETEYRLNWIPLGGYVKMLGQDDLRPNAEAEDPRSYNRKSIGARMLVVSAGVIMNIILAGIGFTALFLYGFRAPPAWVGAVLSDSPATSAVKMVNGQRVPAPIQVGDRILQFQGRPQQDFTKIGLWVALAQIGADQTIQVRRTDGTVEELLVRPEPDPNNAGFLSIGIRQPQSLVGLDARDIDPEMADLNKKVYEHSLPEAGTVKPGEAIVKISGQPVNLDAEDGDFWKLDKALQESNGQPVQVTVRNLQTGDEREAQVPPHFINAFAGVEVQMAGLTPRPMIPSIELESPAADKVLPGDVVLAIKVGNDTTPHTPSTDEFRKILREAGANDRPVTLTLLRNGKEVTVGGLSANMKIDTGKQKTRGLGVGLGYDEAHPVVAAVLPDSPAAAAGIPAGCTITAIGEQKVSNWFEIQQALAAGKPGSPVMVHYTSAAGEGAKALTLTDEARQQIVGLRRASNLLGLKELTKVRKADGPLQAAFWGVTETRDFILQFYLTLRRIFGGSVGADNLMGPIGIFTNGAKVAFRGWDWLTWFLSMISANLAVVNFLPIPIVDGGLFTFLILEKLQGRPLSPRTQAIAQYVGLAFLAGVFLFVTYHDILRII